MQHATWKLTHAKYHSCSVGIKTEVYKERKSNKVDCHRKGIVNVSLYCCQREKKSSLGWKRPRLPFVWAFQSRMLRGMLPELSWKLNLFICIYIYIYHSTGVNANFSPFLIQGRFLIFKVYYATAVLDADALSSVFQGENTPALVHHYSYICVRNNLLRPVSYLFWPGLSLLELCLCKILYL